MEGEKMAKANVMIVEDESIVSMAIGEKLNKLGYDVVAAISSGDEAIKAAEELKPDLVLMDISLDREMDGIDAANRIHRNFNIPVIYLTAYTDDRTVDRAKLTNPSGYLVKPCSERDMKIALEIALHRDSESQGMEEGDHLFRRLFESAHDWVFAKDTQGKYLYMNRAMKDDLGISEIRDPALMDNDLFPEDMAAQFEDLDQRALMGATVETRHGMELRGTYIQMDMMRAALRSESGEVEGLCGIGRIVPDTGSLSSDVNSPEEWCSESMVMAMERIRMAASSDLPCLIIGEPGVGKSHYAEYIFRNSQRDSKTFKTIDCHGVDPAQLEKDIFGEESGNEIQMGALESSKGGVCHLKQIESMPMNVQTRLLEYLKTSEIGSAKASEPVNADVRILASGSEDLQTLVAEGKFNKDLFYGLSFNIIRIPPLRERAADLPILCRKLIAATRGRLGLDSRQDIGESMIKALAERNWPGNLRELRGFIEKVALIGQADVTGSEGALISDTAPSRIPADVLLTVDLSDDTSLPDLVAELKRKLIIAGLDRTNGSVTQAARLLGVSRDSFNYMIKALGITRKKPH